jgi:hypothetical protein
MEVTYATPELSWKMAELYALEKEDFQVFRDLCEAFNSLGKSRRGDPFRRRAVSISA